MARVIWTEPALEDVEAIRDYIAKDSIVYAKRFAVKLIEAPRRLQQFPESGQMVPEFNDVGLRELLYGMYRIIYRIREKDCFIVAVIQGRRDLAKAMRSIEEDS